MDLVVLQAIVNILMSILILLLIFSYRKKLFMLLIIISPFALNAILSPLIINNNSVVFIIQLFLIIGYLLLVVINFGEIRAFINTIINKEIEPTYKGFLKSEARKYQLICFFSFLLSPWILYPVLFYTSFKFYNSFKKTIKH